MLKKTLVLMIVVVCGAVFGMAPPVFAADEPEGDPIKIGVLGVMSGEAASWGLVNKYCTEASATMYNREGGVLIDGVRHKIEVVSIDTRQDPKVALTGAERLVYQEGIKYIIGPNVDRTSTSVAPVMEKGGAMYISYSFTRSLFSPPHHNAILGMIASYQSAPIIYKYLMDTYSVKSIAFVTRNHQDPFNQRNDGIEAAKQLGLTITSWKATYEPGTTDFLAIMTEVVNGKPDLIVLSGVSPGAAPLLIKATRQLGYKGYISTETAQDITILNKVAEEYAEGFIFVGGASTLSLASVYMHEFRQVYEEIAGEWHDEAGTKVYALPMIIYTLQEAGAAALQDVEVFKKAIPSVAVKNPFLKEEKILKYVGKSYFEQARQIGVPMVVNVVKNGKIETLFVGSVE